MQQQPPTERIAIPPFRLARSIAKPMWDAADGRPAANRDDARRAQADNVARSETVIAVPNGIAITVPTPAHRRSIE